MLATAGRFTLTRFASNGKGVIATGRTQQFRSVMTVPRLDESVEVMQKEAIEQIRTRIAKQKAIEAGTHISHAEEEAEMWKWIKITFAVAIPICVLSVFKDTFLIEHPHRKHEPEPDYMRIRNKPFPWECDDCELFNNECWAKCRAEKAAEAAAAEAE